MKSGRTGYFTLSLLAVALILIVGVGSYFLLQDMKPLPEPEAVERRFASEIGVLAELVTDYDPEVLFDLLSQPASARSTSPERREAPLESLQLLDELFERLEGVRKQLSEPAILSASIVLYHPSTENRLVIAGSDEDLNVWSLSTVPPSRERPSVSFCYSGTRQLLKYAVPVGESREVWKGFQLVIDPAALGSDPSLIPRDGSLRTCPRGCYLATDRRLRS